MELLYNIIKGKTCLYGECKMNSIHFKANSWYVINNVCCNFSPKSIKKYSVFILEYEKSWEKWSNLLLMSYLNGTYLHHLTKTISSALVTFSTA